MAHLLLLLVLHASYWQSYHHHPACSRRKRFGNRLDWQCVDIAECPPTNQACKGWSCMALATGPSSLLPLMMIVLVRRRCWRLKLTIHP